MTSADIQALHGGLDSIIDARARKQAIARQLEQDNEAKDIRRRTLKLQEEAQNESRWDRLNRETQVFAERADRLSTTQATLKRQMEQDAWTRSTANPQNQASLAQAEWAKANAKAVTAKPVTPISSQLQGLEEFTEAMSAAVLENEQALLAAQQGTPDGMARAMKAQIKLGSLQQLGQQLLKTAKPDRPTSMVKLRRARKSEDGNTDDLIEELEVPADQWNEQHPAWSRFNTAPKPDTAASTGFEQFEGKVVLDKFGKRHKIVNGQPVLMP